MHLTHRETAVYEEALSLPHYGDYSPGEHYADLFATLARPLGRVIDAGCGTGKGMLALHARGFDVVGCDLTDAGLVPEVGVLGLPVHTGVALWRPLPVRGAYVYCTDVLEHIPPSLTMLVVARLLEAASVGVFLSISLVPDRMGVWVGQALHLSVRRYDEWLADLREIAHVLDARDLGTDATFYLEPRR